MRIFLNFLRLFISDAEFVTAVYISFSVFLFFFFEQTISVINHVGYLSMLYVLVLRSRFFLVLEFSAS